AARTHNTAPASWRPAPCARLMAGSRTTAASGRRASTSWRSTSPNSRRGIPMARPIEASGNVIPFPRRTTPRADWIAAYVRFWTDSLDQLAAYLDTLQTEEKPQMSDIKFDYPADEPSMICTRSFDAPVSLVWK